MDERNKRPIAGKDQRKGKDLTSFFSHVNDFSQFFSLFTQKVEDQFVGIECYHRGPKELARWVLCAVDDEKRVRVEYQPVLPYLRKKKGMCFDTACDPWV